MQPIPWFEEIRLTDTGSVGGKGANLGELTAGGLPVPPGFVITGEAYLDALARAGVREKLVAILGEASDASQDDLDRLADEAKELVHSVPVPDGLAIAVSSAYDVSVPTCVSPYGRRGLARTPREPPSPA